MKKTTTPYLLVLSICIFPYFLKSQSRQDTFYAKKYSHMVEIDMKGLFSSGPGGSLLFRKKHESGNFVFVDRTRFWRLGFNINGNATKQKVDSSSVILSFSNNNYFNVSFILGHETLFHFGKFGLYYAYDLFPNYAYQDSPFNYYYNNNPYYYVPNITNTFGLGLALSGGMRYFINNRFSFNVESTPFSTNFYFEKIRYYAFPNIFINKPVNVKQYGVSFTSIWLRSIGFTYHF